MPDQHIAAQEHALIQQVAEPLSSLPDDPVAFTADADFPIVLRGYDRVAVDAYVRRTSQLVAELQATHSPEAAVRRALDRVGEEVSGVLQRAHEAAEEITSKSRAEAEERLQTARREAREIAAEGKRRVESLDIETDRIWAERRNIVADVRELAGRLSGLAESALERFPAEERPADPAELDAPAPASDEAVTGAMPLPDGDVDGSGDATRILPPHRAPGAGPPDSR